MKWHRLKLTGEISRDENGRASLEFMMTCIDPATGERKMRAGIMQALLPKGW